MRPLPGTISKALMAVCWNKPLRHRRFFGRFLDPNAPRTRAIRSPLRHQASTSGSKHQVGLPRSWYLGARVVKAFNHLDVLACPNRKCFGWPTRDVLLGDDSFRRPRSARSSKVPVTFRSTSGALDVGGPLASLPLVPCRDQLHQDLTSRARRHVPSSPRRPHGAAGQSIGGSPMGDSSGYRWSCCHPLLARD